MNIPESVFAKYWLFFDVWLRRLYNLRPETSHLEPEALSQGWCAKQSYDARVSRNAVQQVFRETL